MTIGIQTNAPWLASLQPTLDQKPSSSDGVASPMNAETLRMLTDAVAGMMLVDADGGEGRKGPAPIVDLRPSTISLKDAGERMVGIVSKLPTLLSALIGSQDPTKSEDGATAKAAEGAAAQAPAQPMADGQRASTTAEGVTGADADVADRSANVGVWIKDSPFSNLLAFLRLLLLKFETADKESSAKMVIIQRAITILAGEKGVEKAREAFGGAMGAAAVTAGIGFGALKKTFEATNQRVVSADRNTFAGNKMDAAAETAKNGFKGGATPASQMREARGLDGKPTPVGKNSERAESALQADADVELTRMRNMAREQTGGPAVNDLRGDAAEVSAKSEIPAGHAMMLNMMAAPIGASVSQGVQIAAEMTEAERQLALQVADVFRRIADAQQDTAGKTRDMRDAAAQLFESLLNLVSGTSAHIISKA